MLARYGTNLFSWLTAPRNDLNSLKLPGRSLSVIPCTLPFIGPMPSPDSSYPNYSIFVQAILHLCALN